MTHSYWLDTTIEFEKKDLVDRHQYDVIIIGAGIAGLSTAYWLEKNNPSIQIAILDRNRIGFGASGRNAGFITCGSAEHFQKLEKQFGLDQAAKIWHFSDTNRELLRSEIIQDDFDSVDFLMTGSCTVAASAEDWSRYQKLALTMKSVGLDVELSDQSTLSKNFGVRNFLGGIRYKNDGVIHPVKLLKKIKSKLKNTQFLQDVQFQSSVQHAGFWTIKTQHNTLTAEKIIFCLNGYAPDLIPELKNLIKPQRGQIIVTEAVPKFIQGPCYLTKHLCYFRQLPNGEILVGGFRNQDLIAENTSEDLVTEKIQKALTEFTEDYFQDLKNIKINYRWSGIMGFTPDGQMILGQLPEKKNQFVMAGCSGHGMGLSFHAAKVLVESLSGRKILPHLDVNRFTPSFFQKEF